MKELEGQLIASGYRFGIVAGRWYPEETKRLIEGAVAAIRQAGGNEDNILLVQVPGSFEIPLTAKELLRNNACDAVIAVGVVLKGETDHYQLITEELSHGLMQVGLETGAPVTFGVITADTQAQVDARSRVGAANKGWEAAQAAISLLNILNQVRG